MKTRTYWLVPALAVAFAVSGCSRSGLLKVTGKVTYKGKPVPSTYLTFQPEGQGQRASHGLTDDDGNFLLTYSSAQAGALPGQHTVFLRYRVSAEEELHEAPPKASRELQAVIARYGDPQKSPLHYEITKNGQFIEINLE